jgi:hypothetical protein
VPDYFLESRKQKDFNVHGFPLEGIAVAGVKAKIGQPQSLEAEAQIHERNDKLRSFST